MNIAPIVLFAYKRPAHLERTLAALSGCSLIKKSTLIVYADAPKHGASTADQLGVQQVRDMIRGIDSCGEVVIRERTTNCGFQNQIQGISEVLQSHDRVIVLEDDMVVAPSFLEFMNRALELYRDDDDVMHVSGYMLPLKDSLPDTLFYNAASCWGWGTWRRAWQHFRDEPEAQLEAIAKHRKHADFDCPPYWYFNQMRDNVSGAVRTWDGMWHASVFLRGGLCLHPGRSLVNNIGHDGTGENCVPSRQFDTSISHQDLVVERIEKREHPGIRRMIMKHYGIRTTGVLRKFKHWLASSIRSATGIVIDKLVPELGRFRRNPANWGATLDRVEASDVHPLAKLYSPHRFEKSIIGAYSYVAEDSIIKNTRIAKFTSIGAGFRCGFGLHPIDTVSTSPVFYSIHKQCGSTFSRNNKVVEMRPIHIGNDVYIGMNVTVLDGVHIGDGAVIGAGAVVTKDIPPYAVAVGVPARVVRYRFDEPVVERLLASKWWDGPAETLARVERHVLDVNAFLAEQESQAKEKEGQP